MKTLLNTNEYSSQSTGSASLATQNTSVSQQLEELFPEQEHYSKEIKRAKQALGTVAWEVEAEQLPHIVAEVQFLCESWLDDFERSMFKGQTLNELLHDQRSK